MKIVVERNVAKVAEFMMRTVRADDLSRVAHALVQIADLFWQPEKTREELAAYRQSFSLERGDDLVNHAVSLSLHKDSTSSDSSDLPS
jgi:hypothetical protein